MKTKKKYGLFKVLLVILLLVVVATYFIQGREKSISYLALGDVFINYVQSFYYFFDTAIFILVVGGLYGALNKVPAYKKLVSDIAKKVSSKKQLFVIVITIVMALISSLTGLSMLFLIFVPFIVSIILLLGYDKLVALSSTIVAILVGCLGGIFVTVKDSSNQYGSSFTTFEKIVGLNSHWANIIPQIILLVLSIGLLVFFIKNYMKKIDDGSVVDELGHNDVFMVEAKDKSGKKIKSNYKGVKIWPIVLIGILMFIILVLGYLPWNGLFGINIFNDFHNWLFGLKIGNYEVFKSLISSSFVAFGEFGNLGSFMMAIVLIALFLFILKFVGRVKFNTLMDGFMYGVKKMIPAAMIAILAYNVLVCTYNNGFFETIINGAADSFGDNVVVNAIVTMLGYVLHVDTFYSISGVVSPTVSALTDKANLNVYAFMFKSLSGLVQIIGPTSLFLIVGLSYLEVPYKKWLKYIWRFVLALFILIFVMLMIISVI